MTRGVLPLLVVVPVLAAGCTLEQASGAPVTAHNHRWFPIAHGTHAVGNVIQDGQISCDSCHDPSANTFTQFSCLGCHVHNSQQISDTLHGPTPEYAYTSAGCYRCHPAGEHVPYDHPGITGGCAACHAEGAPFAALPVPGFTHLNRGTTDCGACHVTTTWEGGTLPNNSSFDPQRNVVVQGLVPSWNSTTITGVSPLDQTLTMGMNHTSGQLPGDTLANCAACHPGAGGGTYYPGDLHASLRGLGVAQPSACGDCHTAIPTGFVGPLASAPARTPASGEMRHDAVEWAAGAPTGTRLAEMDCSVCHGAPEAVGSGWTSNGAGNTPAQFHASLTRAGRTQPGSCLDCHANSRPAGELTAANATLPANLSFDHSQTAALGDCAACHGLSGETRWTRWSGGRFHAVGSSAPSTCLPCHAGQRPASADGWASTTYQASPFDYGTNARGVTHGGGQDCAQCHTGPGRGAWGVDPDWVGGHFPHGDGTLAQTSCIACHTTQRPDLQPGATAPQMAALLGFDHTAAGTTDCLACHHATVSAGSYVHYVNSATGALPGGDWQGGVGYPGATLITSATPSDSLSSITLTRAAPGGLVTGMVTGNVNIFDSMLHSSTTVPAALDPMGSGQLDYTTCWHCHTHTSGAVSNYDQGTFHSALTSYTATPGGSVTPLPQPTSRCNDCHLATRPTGILLRSGSVLRPLDHAAAFTAPVSLGGVSVSGVAEMDCSACHQDPGNSWADGQFHARIGTAVPADCTACHYPLMADAQADVTSGTQFTMHHRSSAVTVQQCLTCHTGALGGSATAQVAAAGFRPGALHANAAPQPSACTECHAVSKPSGPTASSVVYALAQGGTATNTAQWMNHGVADVSSKDCAVCHAADARPAGSAWSTATAFHARVASPAACQVCHGLTNGGGSVVGTKNNLPTGLTNADTLTTASQDATTGVPAGTHDQVAHTDVNVSGHDCNFCHSQAGPSSSPGVQGKEWAQARFHGSFSAASPLVMNGGTGRCSNCHMNVVPGASFTQMDHRSLSAQAGTSDCAGCHTWPGTGTAANPNWLGAVAMPVYITVGGFVIPQPPATGNTTQSGIANLPHPTVGAGVACTTCHDQANGGKRAKGYDHASNLINGKCNACHEAGSDLVGTAWNGASSVASGAGDTRPFTLGSVTASFHGDTMTVTYAKHFYPVDCGQCHVIPAGNGLVTTGTTYRTAWRFPHNESAMSRPSTCSMCHPNGIPN